MGRFKSITSRRVEVVLWIEDDLFYERHVKKTNLANYKMTYCVVCSILFELLYESER